MIDPKDNILYNTITELTESLAESDKKTERLNKQLVFATERELMLRKDMDALISAIEKIRKSSDFIQVGIILSEIKENEDG